MNKKLKFIFKDKKNYKIILYFFISIIFIFFVYLSIPKFFNYTPKLVGESLKINGDIHIKNISNIDYKFFPSPRLRLSGINLEFGKNILGVENAQVDIILDPLNIINNEILDYRKLSIIGGVSNLEIYKANRFFKYIKKNKNKIYFKKNTIILTKENKKLFKINDSLLKVNAKNDIQHLSIHGFFLNHEISFIIKDEDDSKINIIFKVPELDMSTNISLEKIDNFKTFKGEINFEVLNNFFQFNLIKEKNVQINKGFVRSGLINSSFEGDLTFNPFFFFDLNVKPSVLNTKKLILTIKQFFFLDNVYAIEMLKKIDGSLNFNKGSLVFKNREILFQNFELGKKKQTLLNARIFEFGKKGKIHFNLINNLKSIEISGFVIPSSLEINLEKIIFNKEVFTTKKIKIYENKFRNEVIFNSLENIFDEIKLNNFFKTF